MKELYDLKLHETLAVHGGTLIATRVPGGWIYMQVCDTRVHSDDTGGYVASSVFVPLSDEFRPVKVTLQCPKCKGAWTVLLPDVENEKTIKCPHCPIVFDNPHYKYADVPF